jgi:hypothetical protein
MKTSYKLEKNIPFIFTCAALPVPFLLVVRYWPLYNQPTENIVLQIGKSILLYLLGLFAVIFLGSIIVKVMSGVRKILRQKPLEQVEKEEAEKRADAEKKRNEELKEWFEKGSASENAFRIWYKLDAIDGRLTRLEKVINILVIFCAIIGVYIVAEKLAPEFFTWIGKYLGF